MNISRLIKQLEIDEGKRHSVYKDSLGYRTVGIGHLIKDSDPDWIKNLGDGERITDGQMYEIFFDDLSTAIKDAGLIFGPAWNEFPDIAQEVFVNMTFNLGRSRFLKFERTIRFALDKNWSMVAREMMDSRWAEQVGKRASRLSSNIKALDF